MCVLCSAQANCVDSTAAPDVVYAAECDKLKKSKYTFSQIIESKITSKIKNNQGNISEYDCVFNVFRVFVSTGASPRSS